MRSKQQWILDYLLQRQRWPFAHRRDAIETIKNSCRYHLETRDHLLMEQPDKKNYPHKFVFRHPSSPTPIFELTYHYTSTLVDVLERPVLLDRNLLLSALDRVR